MSRAGSGVPSIGLVSWRAPVTGTALLDLAARHGIGGVQLDFGGPGRAAWLDEPGSVETLRDRAAETGVELLAVAGNALNDIGLNPPPGSPAAGEVKRLLTRMLDTATALGCGLLFAPSFRRSAIDGPAALRRTAAMLAWAAGEAAERGLMLANENTLDTPVAMTLIDAVGAPNFRLVLDTYNLPAAGVNPIGVITKLAPYLVDQIHLKDGTGGQPERLGDGDGDVATTLTTLARERIEVRYLVLENDYRDGDETRIRADLAWARDRAATLWQPMGDPNE